MSEPCRPRLIVCTTCRAGQPLAEGEAPPGARLLAALRALNTGAVELGTAACMANCDQGCSAALAAPGKWTYVLGHLAPELAADLLAYAATYAASATGTVMPSRRPASLGRAVIARVPHLETAA